MTQPRTKAPTADRLRHDIDAGRAGDKVPFIDPAAAPLGTDEEAGGHPSNAQQRMQQAETNRSDAFSPVDERGRTISGELTVSSRFWIYVAIAVVVLAGIAGFVLAR